MPRTNAGRSVNREANLRARIRLEREARGWSYDELARRMTDEGCKLVGSAIFKIEKSDPPRRITVDELLSFAEVFGLPHVDLLLPASVAYEQKAAQALRQIDELRMSARVLRQDIHDMIEQVEGDPVLCRIVEKELGEFWWSDFEIDSRGAS